MITSGRGGFASPALMEKFLNDLGKEDWEIVSFQMQPDNILAFNGLARRTTQRDWTLQDAAAAAAKIEADKLRAEFESKFKSGAGTGAYSAGAEEKADAGLAEKAAPEDGFRKPRDTERDFDPEVQAEEQAKDEWDKMGEEDELPSFFDAMKPHMRRNQRGPGMSVGVDYLAKKWDFSDADVIGALKECGLVIPDDEDAPVVYVEYDGDLYWVNLNRRGELWINTKEKPRPVFRTVKATPFATPEGEAPAAASAPTGGAETGEAPPRRPEAAVFVPRPREQAKAPVAAEVPVAAAETVAVAAAAPTAPAAVAGVPPVAGPELLDRVRPLMRRNRRGPGGSGSVPFLARGLRCSEADLMAGFLALGLILEPGTTGEPLNVEIGEYVWWLNRDANGGVWINGREKGPGEGSPAASVPAVPPPEVAGSVQPTPEIMAPVAAIPPPPAPENVLTGVRLLLKETKTGGFAGKLDRVAEDLKKSPDELLAALLGAGLKTPEKAREKPVFVEHAGEIFWLNKNAKDELWVNAKASKFPAEAGAEDGEAGAGDKKGGTRRSRPKKPAE
jgi:hypothetical protein